MDDAISSQIRRCHNLMVGESTAERIKMDIGSARIPDGEPRTIVIKGRDLVRGVPRELEVTEQEIAEALSETVAQIIDVVRTALENTAPEVAADIVESGIVLTGGGSLLADMDVVLAEQTGLPVSIADDALNCVALGAGRALEDPAYKGVLHTL
jgi:rod shape-determining protein MreB